MNQNEEKIKYFLYARKSSESEDRQVQSIDDQVNRLNELAGDLNLDIVEILTESKSAKQPNARLVFMDMLKRIEKGEADGILCWQINRLSRNPVDSGKINWFLQEGIIKAIQTIDKQYLPEDNVLMLSMESGMANQFILDLRKNTKRGLEGKVRRGWLPSKAPQGYKNDVIEKIIVKDTERFNLVRKMWDLMLTGNYQPPKILDMANNEWGYLTRKTKRAGSRPLSASEIYRMFNNPFYYGYFNYNGEIHKGEHVPMITIDEFERVQELLGNKDKPRSQTHEFSFTGIIRCGKCGCLITATEKKKFIKSKQEYATYTYYHCTRRKKEFNCDEPSINLKVLEKQIVNEIEKYAISEEFKDWTLNIIREHTEKEIEVRNQEYEMLNKKYLSAQNQLNNLTKLRLKDLIDDEEFIKEKKELQNQIVKTKAKLDQCQSKGQNWVDLVEKAFNFVTYAKERFVNGDIQTRREILSALGQVYTLKGGKLSIEPVEWLISISNLSKIEETRNNRLEPTKYRLNTTKNRVFEPAFSDWGEYRDSNPR